MGKYRNMLEHHGEKPWKISYKARTFYGGFSWGKSSIDGFSSKTCSITEGNWILQVRPLGGCKSCHCWIVFRAGAAIHLKSGKVDESSAISRI